MENGAKVSIDRWTVSNLPVTSHDLHRVVTAWDP